MKLIYKSPKKGGHLSSPIDESDTKSRAILEGAGWRVVNQEEKSAGVTAYHEPPQVPSEESISELDAVEINATDGAIELAAEWGIDLSEVEGTGKGGRITVDDVRRQTEELSR